ncbi:hypothetical protein NL676_025640 [Syzygium grande]|nr:hypothetical protein NL676_025640 [Syzygium grande]
MDLILLEEKDASDWVYRGEGAANIVLAYAGSAPHLVGKVLRIHKSPTKEIAAQQYARHVISPLLGSKHVDAGIQVLVTREFLEEIERNIKSHRPDWRIDAAKVDTLNESALLISDHSLFPHGIFKGNACISVEIKPKCGFLPFSKHIARQNAIKRSTTRFKMHQVLKFHQQKIPNLSEYDPLDLFSGSKERIHEALKVLYATTRRTISHNSTTTAEALEDVLKYVIEADDGLRMTSFLELLTETVYKSGVLDHLLDVQKLDNYDVEGAIHAYYNFISQPCSVCRQLGEDKVSPISTFLHALPPNESLEIVKKFLIAATAKDCSLMFCFRRREDGGSDSPYDRVYLESTNQVFDYKVHFIDLDLKPLEKMEYYYELDQKIVSAYNEALQNGLGTENNHTKPNGPKQRPSKSSSKSTSSAQDEIEIEIAEVLYGMMRQPQGPSKNEAVGSDLVKFDSREENNSTGDAKSRISSPISNSQSGAPPSSSVLPQNSGSSAPPLTAIAPKRKKPHPVKYEDETPSIFPVRSSSISSTKAEIDQNGAKIEPGVPPGGRFSSFSILLHLSITMSKKTIVSVELLCSKCRLKVMKLVATVEGITSIVLDPSKNTVTVIGEADPAKIIKKVRKFRKSARFVSIGPPKEDKKDEKKYSVIPQIPKTCQRCDVWHVVAEDRYYNYCSIM